MNKVIRKKLWQKDQIHIQYAIHIVGRRAILLKEWYDNKELRKNQMKDVDE